MTSDRVETRLRRVYWIAATAALFTGFGNMPLYGRYYVSDIPGLGWAADFFINVQVHYAAGALLLGLAVYALVLAAVRGQTGRRLTKSGRLRALFLVLALVSGLVMAFRNLPGISLPLEWHMALNFFHLAAAMGFLLVSIWCLVARWKWTRAEAGIPGAA